MKKFILTENLSKLAKALIFLGYDAKVAKNMNFNTLHTIAKRQKRIILSRNKKHKKAFLLKEILWEKQILEIKNLLKFEEEIFFSRCSICNRILFNIDKNKLKNLVLEPILEKYEEFRVCRKCGRIYWKGSHYKQIKDKLKKILC